MFYFFAYDPVHQRWILENQHSTKDRVHTHSCWKWPGLLPNPIILSAKLQVWNVYFPIVSYMHLHVQPAWLVWHHEVEKKKRAKSIHCHTTEEKETSNVITVLCSFPGVETKIAILNRSNFDSIRAFYYLAPHSISRFWQVISWNIILFGSSNFVQRKWWWNCFYLMYITNSFCFPVFILMNQTKTLIIVFTRLMQRKCLIKKHLSTNGSLTWFSCADWKGTLSDSRGRESLGFA